MAGFWYVFLVLSVGLAVQHGQAPTHSCYEIQKFKWIPSVVQSGEIGFSLEGLTPEWTQAIQQAARHWNSSISRISLQEVAHGQNQKEANGQESFLAVGRYPEVLRHVGVRELRYKSQKDAFDQRLGITVPFHRFDPKTKEKGAVLGMVTVFDGGRGWSFDGHPAGEEIDAVTAAMHEFGHWLLLRDLSDQEPLAASPFSSPARRPNTCSRSIMWWQIPLGETKRGIDDDDIEGVRRAFR